MSRLALIGSYLAFCCSALVAADPNTDVKQPVTQPTVAELVQQLGADSYQARTQAWKRLEQLTTDSLPELQEALKQTQDAEIKRRLEQLIPSLERTAALTPTRLSLTIQNKPVRDAIQEIAKKTGYRLELAPGNDREKDLV